APRAGWRAARGAARCARGGRARGPSRRDDRILEPRLGEAPGAQQTGVAASTRAAIQAGLVAGPGQREVHAELPCAQHDLRLAERDQWGVDAEAALALDPRLGGEVGQALEGLHELGPAIRV